MRSTTLLAIGLLLVGIWPYDRVSGETAPPVSLTPPKASTLRAGAKNLPAASSTPATSGLPHAPNPATDYDGFSVGTGDDDDAPDQGIRPTTSRAAKGAKPNPDTKGNAAQQLIDQEDDALKRKLTICKSCK